MSKHAFRINQRIAIWRAWDEACYICRKPLDYLQLEIDHVIPETVLDDPVELQKVRDAWKIDESFPGFQINDFCNWAPAHRTPCNGSKTDYYAPWTMVCLEMVRERLPRVYRELEKLTKKKQQNTALADVDAALERGDVTEEEVQELLDSRPALTTDPVVLTFSLAIDDLYQNPEFNERQLDYPSLCDWLEKDLQEYLATIIDTPFEYSQESERSGETLSVRIVFPDLDPNQLAKFSRSWWTIVEAVPFRVLYDTPY